jgi:bla regulator protein BlaR1
MLTIHPEAHQQRAGALASLGFCRKILLLTAAFGFVIIPVGFALIHAELMAQTITSTSSTSMDFETATIKPSRPDATNSNINFNTGRFTTENISMEFLLKEAYGLNSGSSEQIVGVPGWVYTSKWDINAKEDVATAKALDGMPFDQRRGAIDHMLQTLLINRFGLRAHIDTRPQTVAALVVAKGGKKLKAFSGCSGAPSDPPCSPGEFQGLHNDGHGYIQGRAATLTMLANALAGQPEMAGRTVVDDTGLTEKFSFDLRWTPVNSEGDVDGSSLFAALQAQLGLKLETKKLPIKVLVVEHIEQPSAN